MSNLSDFLSSGNKQYKLLPASNLIAQQELHGVLHADFGISDDHGSFVAPADAKIVRIIHANFNTTSSHYLCVTTDGTTPNQSNTNAYRFWLTNKNGSITDISPHRDIYISGGETIKIARCDTRYADLSSGGYVEFYVEFYGEV